MDFAAVAFRFVLGTVFMLAGLGKVRARDQFAETVRGYGLVSADTSRRIGRWLPSLELSCGLLLTLGLGLRLVSAFLALLLLTFIVAVAINLLRGREIDCGCLGAGTAKKITWATVGRNGLLLGMAIALASGAPDTLSLDRVLATGRATSVSVSDAIALAIAGTLAVLGVLTLEEARRARSLAHSLVEGPTP